jgi:hypothetical protein
VAYIFNPDVRRASSALVRCFIFFYPVAIRAQQLIEMRKLQCFPVNCGLRENLIFLATSAIHMIKLKNPLVRDMASRALLAILRKNFLFQLPRNLFVFAVVAVSATCWIVRHLSSDIYPFLKEEILQGFSFLAARADMGFLLSIFSPKHSEPRAMSQDESGPMASRLYWSTASACAHPNRGTGFLCFHGYIFTDYTGLINGRMEVISSAA